MDEKTFFDYADVRVTNARFINGSQTYAMSNVTSVKAFEETPSRVGGVAVFILGLIIAQESIPIALIIVALSAYHLYKQKSIYHVMLTTAGGETSALRTYQLDYVNKVVGALNEAIAYRG